MSTLLRIAATAAFAVIAFSGAAEAQLSNKPYAFKSSSGGLGMSNAGKLAILNQKLFGFRPDVMLKGADGELLYPLRGPGDNPIVFDRSGAILPSYRGRGQDLGLGAGGFNSFFGDSDGLTYASFSTDETTGSTIDSWTGTVMYGGPAGHGQSSVEQWTSMVHYLGRN